MSKKPRKKRGSKATRKSATATASSHIDRQGAGSMGPDMTDLVPALVRRSNATKPAANTDVIARPSVNKTSTAQTTTGADERSSARLTVAEKQGLGSGCTDVIDDVEPQGFAATYSFDAPESGGPFTVAIRFTGTRAGVKGMLKNGDRFEQTERVEALPAGSGRVSITARPSGINAGEWRVTAKPVDQQGFGSANSDSGRPTTRLPTRMATARTRMVQITYGPAVRLAVWPALVALGAAVAIMIQALLVVRNGLDVGPILAASATAIILGFVGGKAYYLILKRKHPREFLAAGACIQGFLLVALGVVGVAALILRFPVGTVLDATAPGIFVGMAIGRPGCFFTGCCTGRPTGSRWGLRSSDRRVLTRRYPVQLIEAFMAALIGGVSLLLMLVFEPPVPGAVFVAALAIYTFGRQLLFPLRADSHTRLGRTVTMTICGLVVAGAVAASVLG